jgi:hypothetical protein
MDDFSGTSVVLSREEVLAILHLTGLSAIPGLSDDPIANLTAEQRAFGLIVAERALRARGLAIITEEGRLLVQSVILEMLGTCALAAQSLYVTRIATPSGTPAQLIAHRQEKRWVLHRRLELVLHTFQSVGGWLAAMEEIKAFCQWPNPVPGADFTLTIPNNALNSARELAASGHVPEARAALLATGNRPDAVEILIDVLSQAHVVTVIQYVIASSPDTVAIQSVTILHHDNVLLIAVESARAEDNSADSTVIQPVSADDLKRFLHTMVVGTDVQRS